VRLTIWKFPFTIHDNIVLDMPEGATVLSVAVQGEAPSETPCMWALVNPLAAKERRRFLLRGTGHPIVYGQAARFVGTFQMMRGELVFHLFEAAAEPAVDVEPEDRP